MWVLAGFWSWMSCCSFFATSPNLPTASIDSKMPSTMQKALLATLTVVGLLTLVSALPKANPSLAPRAFAPLRIGDTSPPPPPAVPFPPPDHHTVFG